MGTQTPDSLPNTRRSLVGAGHRPLGTGQCAGRPLTGDVDQDIPAVIPAIHQLQVMYPPFLTLIIPHGAPWLRERIACVSVDQLDEAGSDKSQ